MKGTRHVFWFLCVKYVIISFNCTHCSEQKFVSHVFGEVGVGPHAQPADPNQDAPAVHDIKPQTLNITVNVPKAEKKNPVEATHDKSEITTTASAQKPNSNGVVFRPEIKGLNSGALFRGFIVFVGLSVIIMLYILCRSYRLRRPSNSPSMVRKYGVRASRSDIEMRPLPLEEEDDDDTVVFEKLPSRL